MYPLSDVRVVDLTEGIAGGYCTKLLADAGADVVKVERQDGDWLRDYSSGLLFEFLNTSKRSVRQSSVTLEALVASADIVVDNFLLDPTEVLARNPNITYVTITPFGRSGPWARRPATEFTLMAQAGSTSSRGLPERTDRDPYINAGGQIGEWMGGVSAAVATVAALRRAQASGGGDHVDVSLFEAITPTCTNVQTVWGSMSGNYDAEPRLEIPSIEPTKDGYVGCCIFTGQQWQDFCLLIGHPELADDPELSNMNGRIANGERINSIIREFTTSHTTDEIIELGVALRVPVAPIGNGANLTSMQQFVERGVYVASPSGRFRQPRVPYRILGHETRAFAKAPTLGEHDGEIERPEHALPAAPRTPTSQWPLDGVRVCDMTAFWAGPYASYVLSCLGADVIHVESIQRPDGMRYGSVRPPTEPLWYEWGPTFHAANAGKRSITLDLLRDDGKALLRQLIEQSDVLVENFSPRVMDQFGLDWATVHAWNPRLIMVRMPAFGLDGPWRDRVGFAQTMEQTSGMAWLTGYADTDPMNARGPCDPLAGLHAAYSAILGLHLRNQTGEGVHVEATMVETALNAAAEQVIEFTGNGRLLVRDGNNHQDGRVQAVFRSADRPEGTMGCIAVCAETTAQRRALQALTGGDPGAWCAARRVYDAVDALLTAGVPAAAVMGVRHGDRSAQHDYRGFFEAVTHPVTGTHRIGAFPVVFGRQPPRRFARPAPTLGEHNAEVLGGLLGVSAERLDELAAAGIIGTRPR